MGLFIDYDISFFFSKHLQEAKIVSSIHRDTHPAKYARCLFKLSEALRQVPGSEAEVDQQLKEAKELYSQIIDNTTERSTNNSFILADRVEQADFDALIHISQQ